MGYRSTVKFLMREDDYKKLIKISESSEPLERLLTVECDIDDNKTDTYIPDGWVVLTYPDIKWYRKFPEIDFMDPKNLKDNYGINVDFVRIGEAIDDIESIENIDISEKPISFCIVRSINLLYLDE